MIELTYLYTSIREKWFYLLPYASFEPEGITLFLVVGSNWFARKCVLGNSRTFLVL